MNESELDSQMLARAKAIREQAPTQDAALGIVDKATNESTYDLISRAFDSQNGPNGIYQYLQRKGIDADPNFNMDDHPELMEGIPASARDGFAMVRSYAEAEQYRQDALQELEDGQLLNAAGARGVVASGLAGIVDVDLPLTFFSGGTYTGAKVGVVATKLGIEGTRIARMAKYGAAGAEAGIVTESVNAMVRPTGQWEDIPLAGLGGLAFGTALGGIGGKTIDDFKADDSGKLNIGAFGDAFRKVFGKDPAEDANKAASAVREDFADATHNGEAGRIDYNAKPATPDDTFNFADQDYETFMSQGLESLITKSGKFLEDNKIQDQFDAAFGNGASGKAAKKFYNFLNKTPVKSDWDALMSSKSDIGKATAYKLFESPAGIVRNNRSAAMVNDIYTKQIAAPVNTSYSNLLKRWLASTDKEHPIVGMNRQSKIDAFNREVMEELQYRYHDGISNPKSNEHVRTMADNIDTASAKAVELLKQEGSPVRGAETLMPEKGWFRQQWRGDKMINVMRDIDSKLGKGEGRKIIEDTLAKSYMKVNGFMYEDALKYAKAVVTRGIANERGLDTNLARMLDQEGREFMSEYLRNNGFSAAKAEELINGLKGLKSEQNKESILKHRKDIDFREQIPGTEYRIMDLLDTDIVGVWTGYSRRAAGAAAMARQGIQRGDKKMIIDGILSEQAAKGGQSLTREQLEAMFSYFDGGAFAGGLNPWVRRALQTTNLSLLNSLGLTQLAEFGVNVAAVGFDVFRKSAPKELREMLTGKNSELTNELKSWNAFIDGEHNIFMDHLMLDDTRPNAGMYGETGNFLDGLITKGNRIQGYLSGFYKVKQLQQRTAVRSMVYRLADMFTKDKKMAAERLYDLGFTDQKMIDRIGSYFKDGTVHFEENGNVLRLNFDKWNPEDVLDFSLALNRHANQVVQKAMRGESSAWMHKSEGAILAHLKSFTILSMQKQVVRNARIMDTATSMAFVYSAMTAGLAYTLQQAAKGNDKNLDATSIMKGAFNLSNMTGWIPQWSDPVASMLGMDNLRFNHYGSTGVGGDVVGVPPVIPTMNRIAHIPSSAIKTAAGIGKNEDIYALQATPLIGNAMGFSYMFNKMKHGN